MSFLLPLVPLHFMQRAFNKPFPYGVKRHGEGSPLTCSEKPWRRILQPPQCRETLFKPTSQYGEILSIALVRSVEVMREDTQPLPRTSKRFGGGLRRGQKELTSQKKSRWGFYCPPLNPLPQSGRGVCGNPA